eukprot:CAMPEP_0196787058 /NCGR_PEP_ID=MMETSP1104-20130614/22509_1 /TAXON_ID=33652 /ORGANISM="Cafeteria sp., Strain Caron Lab Isolate" /LENGTH=96 /DNA_ID=CAMNT_0042157389 /DNA_START=1 /DNA_END=288 /DNA_ORIENTATION=-
MFVPRVVYARSRAAKRPRSGAEARERAPAPPPPQPGASAASCTLHGERHEAPGMYSSESEDDEPVVERSARQRMPVAGEPVCAVCGRYGAYVCDAT